MTIIIPVQYKTTQRRNKKIYNLQFYTVCKVGHNDKDIFQRNRIYCTELTIVE